MKANVLMAMGTLLLGAVVGFVAGRSVGGGGDRGERTAGAAGASSKGGLHGPVSGGGDRTAGHGADRAGRSPVAVIRRVAQDLENSPMMQMDFDTMFLAYDAIRWMSPEDVRRALQEVEEMTVNPQVAMTLQMMLVSQWAREDGQGAVEYAVGLKQPMQKMMGMMGGLMGWIKQDPENAYRWYEENRDEMKGGMMGSDGMDGMFFSALAQQDMKGAFSKLKELKRSSQRSVLSSMSSGIVMDPVRRGQFMEELEALGDESLRNEALTSMVQMWALQDPEAAADFVTRGEWDADLGKQLRERLAGGWSNIDPEAAMKWQLDNLSEGQTASEVVESGFSQWMRQDPDSAREWLREQPDELRTDQLYQNTANGLRWSNEFAEAVEWAGQIEVGEDRNRTLKGIYDAWSNSDAEAASEWFEALDEEQRQSIEEAVPEGEVRTETLVVPTVR